MAMIFNIIIDDETYNMINVLRERLVKINAREYQIKNIIPFVLKNNLKDNSINKIAVQMKEAYK